jgi:hypothetical protein
VSPAGVASGSGRGTAGGLGLAARRAVSRPIGPIGCWTAVLLLSLGTGGVFPLPGFPGIAAAQAPKAAGGSGEAAGATDKAAGTADEADPAATLPPAGVPTFPFSDAAVGNAILESRLDSVRVEHGDGRPAESLVVRREADGVYLAVGDVGRLGDGFHWNPETWRGSLRFDSTDVGFSLDSPIFWVRGTPVQTPAAVRYRSGTVLVPLSFIDAVLAPLLGTRCLWAPSRGRLVIAAPPPWITTLTLEGNEPTASLAIGPVAEDALRLRWDPLGILLVEARGVRLPVDCRAVSGRAEGVEAVWARCTGAGTEVALRLDNRWGAVRLRGDRGGIVRVELTTRVREVQVSGYQPLGTYAVPAGRGGAGPGGRVVLLEATSARSGAGAGSDCLAALGEALAGILGQEFDITVIRVPDRSVPGAYRTPAGLPETPGIPPGDCWIGLRLDSNTTGGAGEFTIVVPDLPARREPLRLGALASTAPLRESPAPGLGENPRLRGALLRVPPWGQVARAMAPSSARLARTVAEHLGERWADRPVHISARPARIFRGVGVPAILISPAVSGDEEAVRALCDETQCAELARNIAFAVDEFLLSTAGGE